MANELPQPLQTVDFEFQPLTAEHGSAVGLVLREGMSIDEWAERCVALWKVRNFGPFAIGDTYNYGAKAYGDKKSIDRMVKLTGYTEPYIRRAADVCAKIRFGFRMGHPLSFEHHAAVANLKGTGCDAFDEDGHDAASCLLCESTRMSLITGWLQQALQHKWTAKELKDEIKASRSTTVREHSRKLPGDKDFDPKEVKEALTDLKFAFTAVKDQGLPLSTKGALDKRLAKTVVEKVAALVAAAENYSNLIQEALK